MPLVRTAPTRVRILAALVALMLAVLLAGWIGGHLGEVTVGMLTPLVFGTVALVIEVRRYRSTAVDAADTRARARGLRSVVVDLIPPVVAVLAGVVLVLRGLEAAGVVAGGTLTVLSASAMNQLGVTEADSVYRARFGTLAAGLCAAAILVLMAVLANA